MYDQYDVGQKVIRITLQEMTLVQAKGAVMLIALVVNSEINMSDTYRLTVPC